MASPSAQGHPIPRSHRRCRQGRASFAEGEDPSSDAHYIWTGAGDLVKDTRLLVSVVDDSESVRESLPDLLQQFGFAVETFSSAAAFLASKAVGRTSCLILDVGLPGMSGPDLQEELIRLGHRIPIVFITAQDDKSLRPRLVARGAAGFLFKPFSDTALLEALNTALGRAST